MSLRQAIALTGALLALPPLAGCISVSRGAPSCAAGGTRQQVAELQFGRNIGQTLGVSEVDFTRFLDEEVTPRFPAGLTVWDTQGRWLYDGVLYKEPGKHLTLILTGKPDDRRKVEEIATAYETRFHQDSVLIMTHPDCVAFHMSKARP